MGGGGPSLSDLDPTKVIKKIGNEVARPLEDAKDSVKGMMTPDYEDPGSVEKDLPTPPPQIDKEATIAGEQEKKRRLRGRGRASTVLTSPLGNSAGDDYQIGTKTLMGS